MRGRAGAAIRGHRCRDLKASLARAARGPDLLPRILLRPGVPVSGWVALVGDQGEGRDAALDLLVEHLRACRLRVGGFVPRASRLPGHPSARPHLALEDVATGARALLAIAGDAEPDVCSYRFEPTTFAIATRWAQRPGLDVVVLGGLGPLEAARSGHWPLIETLVARRAGPLPILSVRRTALPAIALALPDPIAGLELPVGDDALRDLTRQVRAALGGQPGMPEPRDIGLSRG